MNKAKKYDTRSCLSGSFSILSGALDINSRICFFFVNVSELLGMQGPSGPGSYGGCFYNYLGNQGLSPLKL